MSCGHLQACSFARQIPVEFNSELKQDGETRPTMPQITVQPIKRGVLSNSEWISSCDDTGLIALNFTLDRADKDLIFSFRVVAGDAGEANFERGFYQGSTVEGSNVVVFTFPWIDGSRAHQESMSFVLEITPARRSGLMGDPITIKISDPGR